MLNSDAQPAKCLPEFNSVSVGMAKETEPDIVSAARVYDESRRALERLRMEQRKIEEGIKDAQDRMHESAAHMISIMKPPPEKRAY